MVPLVLAALLLVVEKHNDTVGFYDFATGAPVASVKVGHIPHEFVFSADGKSIYVTNYGTARWTDENAGGNTISIIDLAAKKVSGEINLGPFHRPHGIELGKSGKLYVTCDIPSAIVIVDPVARKIEKTIPATPKSLPHMLALAHDESTLYTANAGDASITAYDLKTNQSKSINVGGVPMGLALTRDEKTIYVTTRTADTVVEIDTKQWKIRRTIQLAGQPVRLQLLPGEKQMLVSLIVDGTMVVLNTRTGKETHRLKVGLNAEGMHIDPKTNEGFISAQGEKRVVRFSLKSFKQTGTVATQERPDPILVWRPAPGR